MQIIMKGRERTVTDSVGRALILLKQATQVEVNVEPESTARPRRAYKRRDLVAAAPAVVPIAVIDVVQDHSTADAPVIGVADDE